MNKNKKKQSDKRTIAILSFFSAFVPLSTDLYLPALPTMMENFGATTARVNMTLSLFFIFFAVGILFWGPLSEKFGRKPILWTGLVAYTVSSILCALAQNIDQLIVFRVLQAFGGGATTAVSTAMVKDLYSGRRRETVLAVVMAIVIIAPVVAPIFGALLLDITSWRGIFWTLAGIGGLAMVAGFFLKESLVHRYTGSVLQSLGRLAVVLKNPRFSWLLGTFSLPPMAFMAFIAASSYIYINGFGLTEKEFSIYFSMNALCAMCGPIVFVRLSRVFRSQTIITFCFAVLAVSGILVWGWGDVSPLVFALAVAPTTLAGSAMRPPSTNLMLDQQQYDTGSASSLINFFGLFAGAVGMFIISQGPGHEIRVLGLLQIVVAAVGCIMWVPVRNRAFIKRAD